VFLQRERERERRMKIKFWAVINAIRNNNSRYLYSTYYMSNMILNTFHILTYYSSKTAWNNISSAIKHVDYATKQLNELLNCALYTKRGRR
jgi:hypothetical protein